MKFLLKENQLNDLRRTLSHSIEDYGIYETLKRYNLNLKSLSAIFKGEKLPEISCADLYDIVLKSKFFKRDLNWANAVIYKDYKFIFTHDEFGGSVFFKCRELNNPENENTLDGYATPYWDGNCYLPIDFEYYTWTDSDGNVNDEDITGEYYYSEDVPEEFNSFNDIDKWVNTEYLRILSEKCEEVFNYIRES
jgi:hypothetical protein